MRILIDGKWRHLQRRKYCLECSPFGKHNTRPLIAVSKTKTCLECGRIMKSSRRNFCEACNTSKQRRRKKEILISYKGGKCEFCGYDKCISNLSFHHIDPRKKDFSISLKIDKAIDALKKEVNKCLLVCCRCHGEIHAGLISIPL